MNEHNNCIGAQKVNDKMLTITNVFCEGQITYMGWPGPSPINSWPTSLTMQSRHKDNIYTSNIKHSSTLTSNIN